MDKRVWEFKRIIISKIIGPLQSKILLEKIKKTYQTDNKNLIPIAVLFLIGFNIAGHVLLGFYGMALIIGLFFFNKKALLSLENINITTNSYDYLIAYKETIDKIISSTFKLLGFGLPLVILPGYWLYFRTSKSYTDFINEFSSLYILFIILLLVGIISLVGIAIYKVANNTLYGKHLSELDMVISDLKDIKQEL